MHELSSVYGAFLKYCVPTTFDKSSNQETLILHATQGGQSHDSFGNSLFSRNKMLPLYEERGYVR
ncbi:MAG: hypothetical protein JMM78_04050 [Candidatus Xiphinematobacter sp.]|nr:MAG: hypothetical protein JMM78_04050 [Candidatus Xiphinematobacter sp.]